MWGDQKIASVIIRSTSEKGLFQIIFMGPEVRIDEIKTGGDVGPLQAELNRISGREDIRIKEVTWQGEWRSVLVTNLYNFLPCNI